MYKIIPAEYHSGIRINILNDNENAVQYCNGLCPVDPQGRKMGELIDEILRWKEGLVRIKDEGSEKMVPFSSGLEVNIEFAPGDENVAHRPAYETLQEIKRHGWVVSPLPRILKKWVCRIEMTCLYKWPERAGERESRSDRGQAVETRRLPSGPGPTIDFSALGDILPVIYPREKSDKEVTAMMDRYPDWKILDAQIRGYELEEPLVVNIAPLKPERDLWSTSTRDNMGERC